MPKISKVVLVVGLGLLPHLAGVFGRPFGPLPPEQQIGTLPQDYNDSNGAKQEGAVPIPIPVQPSISQHSTPEDLMVLMNSLSMGGDDPRLIPGALLTDEPGTMYTEEEAVIQEFMRQVKHSDEIYARATPFGNYGLANDLKEVLKQMNSIESPSLNFRRAIAAVTEFVKDIPGQTVERTPYNQSMTELILYDVYTKWGKKMTDSERQLISDVFTEMKNIAGELSEMFQSYIIKFHDFLVAENYKRPDQSEAAFVSIDKVQALTMYIFDHFLRVDVDHEGQQDVMELFRLLTTSNSQNSTKHVISLLNGYTKRYNRKYSGIVGKILEKAEAQVQGSSGV
ncbi:hypothetical protein H4R34_003702 [Dimargaris verticillata]|uniref:Uncharacterized protein n=1 Tax=Dimargaris verticillata TaxID=2761393 RepID=A0A9W8B418_9FUNG|nr:hypothetical protein H4R34_003702 [Dimargaris verticillata]